MLNQRSGIRVYNGGMRRILISFLFGLGFLLIFFLGRSQASASGTSPNQTLQESTPGFQGAWPVLPYTPTVTTTVTATVTPTATLTPTPTPTATAPPVPPPPSYLPDIRVEVAVPTEPPSPPQQYLACKRLSHPLAIPDGNPAGVYSLLTIEDPGYIVDLNVYLSITHPWVGDIRVNLTHRETGRTISLIDRPGYPANKGGCNGSGITAILDGEASLPVEDQCAASYPSISGSFRPEGDPGAFFGEVLSGEWVLNVADLSENDSGQLNKWCLDVSASKTQPIPTPAPPPPKLPDSAYVDGMHGRDQSMPLDCESRSAVDWAHHFGASIGEYAFFTQLPISDDPDAGFVGDPYGRWGQIPPDPYGVHAEPIAALLRNYGLKATAYGNLAWNDLRAEIAAGRPAIVWVIGDSSGIMPGDFYPVYYTASNGHTSVVSPYEHTVNLIGYTPQSVTILDGSRIYTRSLNQFLVSWSLLRNMAVLGR